jgi:DNA-binding ferritin-like protein
MKKRLSESLEMALVVEHNIDIMTDNMIAAWDMAPYPQLSVLLVYLRFLSDVHQTHHWISKGDSFYGDHQLFSRLYSSTTEEIDTVAEKSIGLGNAANVDLLLQTSQVLKLVQGYGMTSTVPQQSELAKRSYLAEMSFLKVTAHLACSLKDAALMTRGLDNMIQGIEDSHEGSIYLLKQRITL